MASANVEALGASNTFEIRRLDATRLGRPGGRFDTVFLDPPYRSSQAKPALLALAEGWLKVGAVIVVELSAKEPFDPPLDFESWQERRYGQVSFRFLRWRGDEHGSGPS